jgi:hypothetical protein
MALTKDQIIERLNAAGVSFSTHTHAAVMTAEAQVSWAMPAAELQPLPPAPAEPRPPHVQATALSGVPGSVTKNLFLKVRQQLAAGCKLRRRARAPR